MPRGEDARQYPGGRPDSEDVGVGGGARSWAGEFDHGAQALGYQFHTAQYAAGPATPAVGSWNACSMCPMAAPFVAHSLKEVVKWIALHFGKDIMVVLTGTIQSQWKKLFAARNIMILGPKQCQRRRRSHFTHVSR